MTFIDGEELIWTHENGTTERVHFKRMGLPLPNPTIGESTFPRAEPMAIVIRGNGKELTVPICQLSRPD